MSGPWIQLYWVLLFPSVRAHNFLSLNLQQLLLFAADFFFVRCNYFLFAATTFYLHQLHLFCSNFLFAACPLWATVLNRSKRKSFHGKLHKLWSSTVRKHLQKHKPKQLIAQYAWNRPASSTSKCKTQSGKIKFAQCRILHALHKLHKKRARERPLLFKLTLRSH